MCYSEAQHTLTRSSSKQTNISLLVKRMIYLYIVFPLTVQSPSVHTHSQHIVCSVHTQQSYLSAAPLTCATEPLASTLTYVFSLPPSLAHSLTSPNAHCLRHWISCITTPSLFQISLFLFLSFTLLPN